MVDPFLVVRFLKGAIGRPVRDVDLIFSLGSAFDRLWSAAWLVVDPGLQLVRVHSPMPPEPPGREGGIRVDGSVYPIPAEAQGLRGLVDGQEGHATIPPFLWGRSSHGHLRVFFVQVTPGLKDLSQAHPECIG